MKEAFHSEDSPPIPAPGELFPSLVGIETIEKDEDVDGEESFQQWSAILGGGR